jgi:sugar-specific transcriptional regulator TrmB
MDIIDLQEVGLTEQEAKIYLALVGLGKASASQIAAEGQVSYGTIYDVLSHMERKGLVKTVPERTKRFIATDPEHLLQFLKAKEQKLERVKKGVAELKQRYEQEGPQPVVIAQGKANFTKLMKEMAPAQKRSYSVRPIFDPHPEFYRNMREKIAKRIDYRVLYGPNANKDAIAKWGKENIPMRAVPFDNIIMSLDDDEVLLTLLKKNTTIVIRDKDFADMMSWLYLRSFE